MRTCCFQHVRQIADVVLAVGIDLQRVAVIRVGQCTQPGPDRDTLASIAWQAQQFDATRVSIAQLHQYSGTGSIAAVVHQDDIHIQRQQWLGFAFAGALAGLAGGLFVFSKGSVFPDVMSIQQSFDGLLMVLLGGVQTLAGPLAGATAFTWLHDEQATSDRDFVELGKL